MDENLRILCDILYELKRYNVELNLNKYRFAKYKIE
jgi:hypothetical protein